MRVFLGNPPWKKPGRLGVRAGSRWPFTQPLQHDEAIPPYVPFPFYLAYGTAVLKRAGFEVLLVDAVAEGIDSGTFLKRVQDFRPDLAFFETSTPSIADDLANAKEVHEIGGARIALAGPHASVFPDDLLKENPWLDFVLTGEYEQTLLELCQALDAKDLTQEIAGASIRQPDGSLLQGPRRELIPDINWFPWPAREFLPMHHYRDDFAALPNPNVQMWASRGCPYTCIFCLWPAVMYGNTQYRTRTPADVAEEMRHCVDAYQMQSVFFDDDTFNIGKKRMLELAEEIRKRDLNIPWAIMGRADLAEEASLKALKGAGLYAAKYGIESGNQAIVDRADKRLDLQKAERGIRLTKDLGIKVHLTFSVGLPGETWDTVRETIDFALRMEPETLQFSINTPFPGTPYYKTALAEGHLQVSSWADYDGAATSVVRTEALSGEDLEKALYMAKDAWENFYLRRQIRRDPLGSIVKAVKNPKKTLDLLKSRLTPAHA